MHSTQCPFVISAVYPISLQVKIQNYRYSMVFLVVVEKYGNKQNVDGCTIHLSCIGIFHAASFSTYTNIQGISPLNFQGILHPYQWIKVHPGILCQFYSKPTVLLG